MSDVPQEEDEDLLSAREAVRQLAAGRVSVRTAQERAQRAGARGDRVVRKVGTSWVAPRRWWRALLEPPSVRGRPRTHVRTREGDRDASAITRTRC